MRDTASIQTPALERPAVALYEALQRLLPDLAALQVGDHRVGPWQGDVVVRVECRAPSDELRFDAVNIQVRLAARRWRLTLAYGRGKERRRQYYLIMAPHK